MSRLWTWFIDHYRAPRVLGLDLVRIWASLTVVAFHGSNYSHRGAILGRGWLAVDVFFVLSGWLLTGQALRLYARRESGWRFATGFWTRRWFRILPAYWLIILLVTVLGAVLPIGFGLTRYNVIPYLLFLQTVFGPNLYGVTWSLVAEEGFYLALPFVIILFALIGRWRVTVAALGLILVFPLVARVIGLHTIDSWTLRQLPQFRFDGLVVGASLAAMWTVPRWRAQVMRARMWLFAAGLVTFGFLYLFAADGTLFYTAGLLAVAVSVGIMIPQLTLVRWPAFVPPIFALLVTFLSDLTYPLYLFHPLGFSLADLMNLRRGIVYFAVALPMILGGAITIHVLVERPFLAWRARLAAGSNLVEAAEPVPAQRMVVSV